MAEITTKIDALSNRDVAGMLALWTAASAAVAASGVLTRVPLLVPASLAGIAAALVVAYRRRTWVRAVAQSVDLRVVIGAHALRAVIGAAFLAEHAAGRLPTLFALRGGYGDILAGALALAVLPLLPADTRARRTLVALWNAFALADILMVVATAQYLVFVARDATMLAAFARFPYPMLPTLIVPLVLATHVLVFARLARSRQI